MQKNVLLILTLCLLFLTGCGAQKLVSKNEVNNYLKKEYPGEKFKIVSVNQIKLQDVGGCDDGGTGNSWKIKSLNTNIEFDLADEYHFNSFACEYTTNDKYFNVASEKFLSENNDFRMKSYYACDNCMGLLFERKTFNSNTEMFNFIKKIISKLNNTYPFKHNTFRDNIYFSIYNFNSENPPITLEEISNEKTLNEIIEKFK